MEPTDRNAAKPRLTRAQWKRRKRLRLARNWAILILVCAVIVALMTKGILWLLPKVNAMLAGPQSFDAASYDGTGYSFDADDERFVLVNTNLPFAEEPSPALADADEASGIQLEAEAAAAYQKMAAAAAEDGVALVLTAGYQDADARSAAYETQKQQYLEKGKTEEEAIRKALQQLQMDRDDVSVEILERAKSGFLGIGSSPARVRVTYGQQEPEAPAAPVQPEKKPEKKPEPKPQQPKPQKAEAPKAAPKAAEAPAAPVQESCQDDNARRITEFLTGLLEHMDSPAQVQVTETEKGRYSVVLEGQKLGQLIGRRGETLDAIQQLTNYAVNSGREKRIRVHVDAENYRAKREQSLESLARKVAGKVTKYRRSVTLEPMNAYERHVIHAALQDVPGVNTYSIGTEPNRRVVVSYDRDKR